MKKILAFVIVGVVVLLGIGSGIGALAIANQPENVAGAALTGSVEDLMLRDEIKPLLRTFTGGSVELSAELGEDMDHVGFGGKMYFDCDAVMLEDLFLQYEGHTITAEFYTDKKVSYILNDEILGGAYGVERGNVAEQFENSVFACDSDSEYALSEEDHDIALEVLRAFDEGYDQELEQQVSELAERYGRHFWALICEHAEFEMETTDRKLQGSRCEIREITATMDDDAVCDVLEEMLEYIRDDAELEELVEQYAERYEKLSERSLGRDLEEYYEDIIDELDTYIEEISDKIKDAIDGDIEMVVCVPAWSTDLLYFELAYDGDAFLSLDCGPNGLNKSRMITLSFGEDGDEYTYALVENNEEEVSAEVSHNGATVLSFDIDREDETFELSCYMPYGDSNIVDCTITGAYQTDDDVTTIAIRKLEGRILYCYTNGKVAGVKKSLSWEGNVTVTLREQDDMPEPEKDINPFFLVDEDDVETWENNAEETYGERPDIFLFFNIP